MNVSPAAASTAPRLKLFIIFDFAIDYCNWKEPKETIFTLLFFFSEGGILQFELLGQVAVQRQPSWRIHTHHSWEPSHSSPNRLQF
jgi:hypothetical protein